MGLMDRIVESLAIGMYYWRQAETHANGRSIWHAANSTHVNDCVELVTPQRRQRLVGRRKELVNKRSWTARSVPPVHAGDD